MSRTWSVGELTLSGIEARPAGTPLGTVIGLHGGGYGAGYWHHPLLPVASLLDLGASLGYRVIAIDRPGYGASRGLVGPDVRMARQAEIVVDLIDGLSAEPDCGPVFLIGHSMGAILALHVAAHAPSALGGVDISGLPFSFDGSPAGNLSLEQVDFLPAVSLADARQMFYGPDGTFVPEALKVHTEVGGPIPAAEIIDAIECGYATRKLAPSVRVPVQITRAEHEASSAGDAETLRQCCSLFSDSTRVVPVVQVASGHNISLHHVARAYHLRAFAFFDETRVLPGHR
ncbi:alpha/beta fold hydrolase [Gordonia polyisoprenivorans]|uniref:alpha/beta fold hydrolase n=1 Tax=Gordonia polyisoprenivorans TaxID=84595 RepID=UPI001AD77C70|nr:alpha/beta fold hydrolase [Gordonia polyisoprenivorans]QTI70918.1 alpha/beta fold hydrolase [Gordonia polyisoprenivorans]